MSQILIPYSDGHLELDVPDRNLKGIYRGGVPFVENISGQEHVVLEAMEKPVGSRPLEELAKGKKNMVVITSDHTRPVPSKIIMPCILRKARENNPSIDITILVATGFHRATTHEELVAKLGGSIVENEKIVVHDSLDDSALVRLNDLPSGGKLLLNQIAVETELLVAEGFIEPHFFAGFSGGRKSVLPGVAGAETVLANHCAEFINSPFARTGSLENNPIHEDMLFAAREAGLDFIVNVVIDENKNIAGAFAGHFEKAHSAGCEYLRKLSRITVPPSDIVITSNGGYPLDQNIYQAVKGMTAAEAAVRRGGVIIMCAACGDGHGGQSFYDNMSEATSPPELLKRVSGVPREKTASDQWEFQILARILTKARVIIVTGECPPEMITSMHMEHAYGIQEALDKALKMKGPDAEISVIPDGVSVVTQSTENKRGKKWV